MSGLVLKQCPICFEAIPFERVLFLLCGHKICDICMSKCQAKCGVCRKPIPPETAHRIYLTMEEIVDNRASQLVHGLDAINLNSRAADVATVSNSMQKLVATTEIDSPTTKDILKAIEDMEERMAPLLQQLEILKEENNSLRDALQKSDDRYQRGKKQMQKASQSTEAKLKEKRDTLDRFRCSYEKAAKELDKRRDEIEARDKQIKLLRTKMKGVLKQQKRRKSSSGNQGDISLQIEEKLADSVQVVPSKRLSESLRSDANTERPQHQMKRKKHI